MLSTEGSAANYYAVSTIAWSPDSKYIAAYRIRPGYRRVVDYVESSPPNQLQPIHSTMVYPKPGDVLAYYQPVLFDVASHRQFEIDSSLFPNQFDMKPIEWWKDSRGFTFEYNQRGHQLYPVIEDIYAGPQGSFVPKSFSLRVEPLTALGFAVAQIDGMGTNNRSRAFHDITWKNLKDAGFPDRILWHKALAAKYPWYDITRVGTAS